MPSKPQATPEPTKAAASFVDRVWRVAESTAVAPGTLYEFRGDGTLVITSAGNQPMVGTWTRSERGLVMVEESIPYQVEVLELTANRFVIRSHNPGEPVDITLVPAETTGAP